MLWGGQREQQAACSRTATGCASLEAVPASPSCQEMVLFVLACHSQTHFTAWQLPFLQNSHNPVCNKDTSSQMALADTNSHTPRGFWGFICTVDATGKPDVLGGFMIPFCYSSLWLSAWSPVCWGNTEQQEGCSPLSPAADSLCLSSWGQE